MSELFNTIKKLSDIKNKLATTEIETAKQCKPNLNDMPVEVILKICSYLDPYLIKNTLSKVSRRFQEITSDGVTWKCWVRNRTKGAFPPVRNLKAFEDPTNWIDVCTNIDFEKKKWTNPIVTTKHIVVRKVNANSALLVNEGKLCISSGRYKNMTIFRLSDLSKMASEAGSEFCIRQSLGNSPNGWVVDLAPDHPQSESLVYSACMDNSVRAWDLHTFKCVADLRCRAPMSVVGFGREVMTGLNTGEVVMFDIRTGRSPICRYQAQRGPIKGLQKHNNLVASISIDNIMTIWDKVAGKILKKSVIEMTNKESYPTCISWSPMALYVNDSEGYMHLFHPEEFTCIRSHKLSQPPTIGQPTHNPYMVVSCLQTDGTMIVCTNKAEIKFMYNVSPPEEYSSVQMRNGIDCRTKEQQMIVPMYSKVVPGDSDVPRDGSY